MLSLFKNTIFIIWLIGALTSLSIGLATWAFQTTATVAKMSAEAAITTVKHREKIATTITKTKAKARLKRMITMIPLAGVAAGIYFEEQEYKEWKVNNVNGAKSDYICEVAKITLDVLDEVLNELPEKLIPSQSTLNSMIKKCKN